MKPGQPRDGGRLLVHAGLCHDLPKRPASRHRNRRASLQYHLGNGECLGPSLQRYGARTRPAGSWRMGCCPGCSASRSERGAHARGLARLLVQNLTHLDSAYQALQHKPAAHIRAAQVALQELRAVRRVQIPSAPVYRPRGRHFGYMKWPISRKTTSGLGFHLRAQRHALSRTTLYAVLCTAREAEHTAKPSCMKRVFANTEPSAHGT